MKKIFVAGHNGMVGSAICRKLTKRSDVIIITKTRSELDLCNQAAVQKFMSTEKPDEVILAAAKVGGIYANYSLPAEFIYENLQIQNNVINSSHLSDVQKLLFLGSSCIYPKKAKQPIDEAALLTGTLEPTNEPYSIAKIAGIKMCESYNRQYCRDYRSVMPTNLYGPGDNYNTKNSHVLPALIRRFHEAKINDFNEVVIWGTGKPIREFLYVDDMAEASLLVHELSKETYDQHTKPTQSYLNVGTGSYVSIKKLAMIINDIVGYKGKIVFDTSMPDGTIKKTLSSECLNKLGWKSKFNLKNGIKLSYLDFIENHTNLRL